MALFKSHQQPLCRACGKPIRKHTTMVIVKETPSPNDQRHASWCRYVYAELRSKADCQKHSNQEVVHVSYTCDTDSDFEPIKDSKHVDQFREWDGETYVDQFFCGNGCAASFGRMAARSGKIASQAWTDADRRQRGLEVR